MRTLLGHLYSDNGFNVSTELVLVATIAVLAMIVGLNGVKSGVDQAPAEVSAAIRILPRPYDFSRLCSHDGRLIGIGPDVIAPA